MDDDLDGDRLSNMDFDILTDDLLYLLDHSAQYSSSIDVESLSIANAGDQYLDFLRKVYESTL